MPFAQSDWLPSYEDLTVEEINLTSAPLKAGAHHFGKYCDHECKEFMLCRREEKDPRKCLAAGKEVTRCGLEFFHKLKKECAEEFTKYWQCMDHSQESMYFKNCRKTQAVYDKCVFEKLNQERPPLGYFSKVRVHDSVRPRPQRNIPMPEPTPEPADPKTEPTPDSAKLGSRFHFLP